MVTKYATPLRMGVNVRICRQSRFLNRGFFLVVVSGLKELKEKKRTIFALVAASVISLVVWGLVVALNVR
jgi:hypothetical protein